MRSSSSGVSAVGGGGGGGVGVGIGLLQHQHQHQGNTGSYLCFPNSSVPLLEHQDTNSLNSYQSAASDHNNVVGCFKTRDFSASESSPGTSSRSSPNTFSALWHAIKLKRAQNKHSEVGNNNNSSSSNSHHHSDCSSSASPSPDIRKSSSFRLKTSSAHHRRFRHSNSSTSTSSSSSFDNNNAATTTTTTTTSNATFSICRALRRSVVSSASAPSRRLKHKSKSDNCLHRIDAVNTSAGSTAASNGLGLCCSSGSNRRGSHHDLTRHKICQNNNNNNESAGNRFTRKVFDLTNAITARVYPSGNNSNITHHNSANQLPQAFVPASSVNEASLRSIKAPLTKTRSLEKDFEFRVNPKVHRSSTDRQARSKFRGGQWVSKAETQRRTRSLERNHRYLVTIDSTCRYSREVGSNQINLDQDLSARYQPDPTFRLKKQKSISNQQQQQNKEQDLQSETHVEITPAFIERALLLQNNKMPQQQNAIVNKPARGWLHPDHLFAADGVNYAVRYIGCLEVNTSMKVLDFDTRSVIAKECISRVCEAAGLKSGDRRRRVDRKIASMLGETPRMDQAGVNVQLTITSLWLKLSDLDTGKPIFVHDMPNISFASGGDKDTLDFVAYVAKDSNNLRSCFVLECGGGLAQDVITTVGQAFELRFKEYMKKSNPSRGAASRPPQPQPPQQQRRDEVEYYNDMPGKQPPPTPLIDAGGNNGGAKKKDSVSSNLIDFSTDLGIPHSDVAEYVNGNVTGGIPARNRAPPPISTHSGGAQITRDPFDMSPFSTHAPSGSFPTTPPANPMETQRLKLLREPWFHGPMSRGDAELLLQNDGDFLVRESQGPQGQYVLTGMQSNSKKHLLLVDPEGVVRTKDRTFESVSHLIDYHRDNNLPIISKESALRLKTPVLKLQQR